MLGPGDAAPSFRLPATSGGEALSDPWAGGPAIVAFFKVTCPTCKLVAPKIQALADAGARVTAIGQDPVPALAAYAEELGQRVPTASDSSPYEVSNAYGIRHVPTIFLVGEGGEVIDSVASWDREGWNRLAANAGVGPISSPDDGFPSFRPG